MSPPTQWLPDLDTPGQRVFRAGYAAGYADCLRDYAALLTGAYSDSIESVCVRFARDLLRHFISTRRTP